MKKIIFIFLCCTNLLGTAQDISNSDPSPLQGTWVFENARFKKRDRTFLYDQFEIKFDLVRLADFAILTQNGISIYLRHNLQSQTFTEINFEYNDIPGSCPTETETEIVEVKNQYSINHLTLYRDNNFSKVFMRWGYIVISQNRISYNYGSDRITLRRKTLP